MAYFERYLVASQLLEPAIWGLPSLARPPTSRDVDNGPSLSGTNLTEKRLGSFGKFPNEPNEPSNEPFGDYRKIFDILDRSFAQ